MITVLAGLFEAIALEDILSESDPAALPIQYSSEPFICAALLADRRAGSLPSLARIGLDMNTLYFIIERSCLGMILPNSSEHRVQYRFCVNL